jgi:6-phosphofructokinase 1
MRVGILTGGGDAPGLNGIIESVARTLLQAGCELIGVEDGFEGIFEGRVRKLELGSIEGIHSHPGTLLGTSNKCGTAGREPEFLEKYKRLGLDGLVVCGGDGTFSGVRAFHGAVPMIGVPKTIDNDLSGTEITFGYDTACSVVANAADELRFSANAHRRAIVIETMGRTAGWIALGGGLASYADVILIPERPYSPEALAAAIRARHTRQRGLIAVVSEGAAPAGGKAQVAFTVEGSPQPERLGGIGAVLARWIEKETGWESRHVILGHLQRSSPPTTTDRFLTLAMGVEVARMVLERVWDHAAVYRAGQVQRAPVAELMGPARLVDPGHRWVRAAQAVGLFV